MSQQPPQPVPPRFTINLPPEVEPGHYADFAAVWHNPETFVMDFAAMSRAVELKSDDSGPFAAINARVVARVRIPASQAFELMKALNQQLGQWEAQRAQRAQQQPPDEPPMSPGE